MRNKLRRHSFLVFGLVLALASLVMACGRPMDSATMEPSSSDDVRQQIIDYLHTMMPVFEAHADWYDDQGRMAFASDPDYSETMATARDLLRRMERIYMDVGTSVPPPVLRDFKHGWSEECHLIIQALSLMIESLNESDMALAREGDELIFEANNVKDENMEELSDLLRQYDIDFEDLE